MSALAACPASGFRHGGGGALQPISAWTSAVLLGSPQNLKSLRPRSRVKEERTESQRPRSCPESQTALPVSALEKSPQNLKSASSEVAGEGGTRRVTEAAQLPRKLDSSPGFGSWGSPQHLKSLRPRSRVKEGRAESQQPCSCPESQTVLPPSLKSRSLFRLQLLILSEASEVLSPLSFGFGGAPLRCVGAPNKEEPSSRSSLALADLEKAAPGRRQKHIMPRHC